MASSTGSSSDTGIARRAFLRSLWHHFRSLKFGLFLLALIALCLVRASLIAADATLGPEAIHEAKNRVYGTEWFFALLLLFTVQFVLSTWHVTRMSFAIPGKKVFWRTVSSFDRPPYRAVIERGAASPEAIEKIVARHSTAFHRDERDTRALYGHRGLLSRIGPTGVHSGILTILLAGMLWAWMDRSGRILTEARWICAEGETGAMLLVPEDRAHSLGPGNQRSAPIRAQIRLLDFDVVNHPHTDEPAHFHSILEIREPDKPGRRIARVDMNTPCRIDGLIYHQAAYIPMPKVNRAQFDVRQTSTGRRIAVVDSGEFCPIAVDGTDLILEVSAAADGAAWALARRSAPTSPIAWGRVGLTGLSTSSSSSTLSTLSTSSTSSTSSTLSMPSISSIASIAPPRPGSILANIDRAAPPAPGDFEIRYLEPAQGYATVLSVISENPALPLIWIGVLTVFVFAMLTFTIRYRQIFGLWDESRERLHLALVPHREHYPLQGSFASLLEAIQAAGGRVIEARMPAAPQALHADIRPATVSTASESSAVN